MSKGSPTHHGHNGSEEETAEILSALGVVPVTKKAGGVRGLLDGLRDFCHVLSADGQILYVSTATTIVTGHACHDIAGRHINNYIHRDDQVVFKSEFYDALFTGNSTRFIYRFSRPDGSWTILESVLYPYTPGSSAQAGSAETLIPGRHVLVVARPYESKNNALLDSFLEHKIEHERLLSQLQALRTEELDDESEDMTGTTPATTQHGEDLEAEQADTSGEWSDMHEDTVEHSLDHGRVDASTNARSSTVGDLGIPVSENRNLNALSKRHSNKKSKKEPHICMFCGTVNSPEWRKGPNGPRTLCNACGLRWSKSSARGAATSSVMGSEERTIKEEDY